MIRAMLLPALLCLTCAAPAIAEQASSSMSDGVARISLVDGWRTADGKVVAAVAVRLAPGWHTYWRNPGDVGMPPDFDWTGSENLADVAIDWPTPRVFESDYGRSIGYADAMVLPITLTPRDPSRPIDLALDMKLGVCSEVCMPDEAQLSARFGSKPVGAKPGLIRAALAARPRGAEEAGVSGATCELGQAADGLELTATVTFRGGDAPDAVTVIESSQPGLWIGVPEAERDGRSLTARAPIETRGAAIDRSDLRLTLLADGDAIEIRGCASGQQAAAGP